MRTVACSDGQDESLAPALSQLALSPASTPALTETSPSPGPSSNFATPEPELPTRSKAPAKMIKSTKQARLASGAQQKKSKPAKKAGDPSADLPAQPAKLARLRQTLTLHSWTRLVALTDKRKDVLANEWRALPCPYCNRIDKSLPRHLMLNHRYPAEDAVTECTDTVSDRATLLHIAGAYIKYPSVEEQEEIDRLCTLFPSTIFFQESAGLDCTDYPLLWKLVLARKEAAVKWSCACGSILNKRKDCLRRHLKAVLKADPQQYYGDDHGWAASPKPETRWMDVKSYALALLGDS